MCNCVEDLTTGPIWYSDALVFRLWPRNQASVHKISYQMFLVFKKVFVAKIFFEHLGNSSIQTCPSKPAVEVSERKELDDLPTEILIKILSHLSTYDLLRKVALVSKHFYSVTKCPGTHINVTIRFVFWVWLKIEQSKGR